MGDRLGSGQVVRKLRAPWETRAGKESVFLFFVFQNSPGRPWLNWRPGHDEPFTETVMKADCRGQAQTLVAARLVAVVRGFAAEAAKSGIVL